MIGELVHVPVRAGARWRLLWYRGLGWGDWRSVSARSTVLTNRRRRRGAAGFGMSVRRRRERGEEPLPEEIPGSALCRRGSGWCRIHAGTACRDRANASRSSGEMRYGPFAPASFRAGRAPVLTSCRIVLGGQPSRAAACQMSRGASGDAGAERINGAPTELSLGRKRHSSVRMQCASVTHCYAIVGAYRLILCPRAARVNHLGTLTSNKAPHPPRRFLRKLGGQPGQTTSYSAAGSSSS